MCLEEVAFDQGRDPDVESVKGLAAHFQDWFDLETFRASGVMVRAPSNARGPAVLSPASCHLDRTDPDDVEFFRGCPARSPCGGGSVGRTPTNGSTSSGRRRVWSRGGWRKCLEPGWNQRRRGSLATTQVCMSTDSRSGGSACVVTCCGSMQVSESVEDHSLLALAAEAAAGLA